MCFTGLVDETRIGIATTLTLLRSTEGLEEGELIVIEGVASACEYTQAPTTKRNVVGHRLLVERQPGPIFGLGMPWELIADTNYVVPFEIDVGDWPVRVEPERNNAIVVGGQSDTTTGGL